VTFKNIKFDCHLSAEGILLEDLIVDESSKRFDDSIFCIHLQRQYSASRELEEFISTKHSMVKQTEDFSMAKYFQALKVKYVL
jgi:hypothetical protein